MASSYRLIVAVDTDSEHDFNEFIFSDISWIIQIEIFEGLVEGGILRLIGLGSLGQSELDFLFETGSKMTHRLNEVICYVAVYFFVRFILLKIEIFEEKFNNKYPFVCETEKNY